MENESKAKHILKDKIINLAQIFSNQLSLPKLNFLTQMMYGISASQDILISSISREICSANEKLASVHIRLLRHIKGFKNLSSLQDIYQDYIGKHIQEDTIFCVDNSDITKAKPGKKFEYIANIHDGSTGTIRPGYYMTTITALRGLNKNPFSVYSKVFSLSKDPICSLNMETESALLQSFKHYQNKGLYVFDRGYDDVKLFQFMNTYQANFLVRLNDNRNVIYKKQQTKIVDVIEKYKGRITFNYYGNDKVKISYIPIELPKIKNTKFTLVVIHRANEDPLILLTNVIILSPKFSKSVAKAYILRWKIEEQFRFIKQNFKLENIRLGKLSEINLINFILQLITYLISEISCSESILKDVIIKKSQPLSSSKKVRFDYYQIARGISKLFQYTFLRKVLKINRNSKKTSKQLFMFKPRIFNNLHQII